MNVVDNGQWRDALLACELNTDEALAVLPVVQAADEFKDHMTATCTWWSDSDNPHLANYMTDAGAVCFDCAAAFLKAGGRGVDGLPPLPDIHALKILRTAERAALAAAGV